MDLTANAERVLTKTDLEQTVSDALPGHRCKPGKHKHILFFNCKPCDGFAVITASYEAGAGILRIHCQSCQSLVIAIQIGAPAPATAQEAKTV